MAIQQGIFPFSGKIGKAVGYSRGNKNFTKTAAKPYRLTDESKKSGSEFGRGSSASALVKQAFASHILKLFKADLHNRLSERFREVIRSGPLEMKGERGVFDGNVCLLKGFEFSQYTAFNQLLCFSPDVQLSAESIVITIPGFDWKNGLKAPEKASRAIIGLVCGFFDFNDASYRTLLSNNLIVEYQTPFRGGSLKLAIPQLKEQIILVMMTIYFESSTAQKIDNRLHQAGIILEAAHIRDGELVEFNRESTAFSQKETPIIPDVSWELEN